MGKVTKPTWSGSLQTSIFAGTVKTVVVSKVDRIARQTHPGVQNQPKRPPARRALTRGRLEAIGVRFAPGGAIVCREVVPT